jgi:uroporphyrinogen-III synthase
LKVLVTRPVNVAQPLCEKIKAMGAIVELFPVIDIIPTPHQQALSAAIEELNTVDIAIFVSRSAASFGTQAIKKQWHAFPDILWAAIGPGTAKTLQECGISSILLPLTSPYETESLLKIKALQAVKGKKILVFRGNGGRNFLSKVLQARGASVKMIETYQRCLPTINMVERVIQWRHNPIEVIVVTSNESLYNLLALLGTEVSQQFKKIPIIVVGVRMFELAHTLGFKTVLLSADADDASIMAVLTNFKDKRIENGHL